MALKGSSNLIVPAMYFTTKPDHMRGYSSYANTCIGKDPFKASTEGHGNSVKSAGRGDDACDAFWHRG